MTRLRTMMLEELQRRNYAETTIRHYIRTVDDFARRFNCPPDRLARPATHSRISSGFIPEAEIIAEFGYPASGGSPILLHQHSSSVAVAGSIPSNRPAMRQLARHAALKSRHHRRTFW
jgi:hypothetical protein